MFNLTRPTYIVKRTVRVMVLFLGVSFVGCDSQEPEQTWYKGMLATPTGSFESIQNDDEKLTVNGDGHAPFGVRLVIPQAEQMHVFNDPVPLDATMRHQLFGSVNGTQKQLVETVHAPDPEGKVQITANFEDILPYLNPASLQVRFLNDGVVQYEAELPLQDQIELAFYPKWQGPIKSSTSTYWAHLEGCTWILMHDWTKPHKAGHHQPDPVALVPAFDQEAGVFQVDYLQIEFQFNTDSVQPEALETTVTNTNQFTINDITL